ncbi:hypothetical protein Y032_0583g304 [Ancylostoma ceylanicum]|nr:hypothetical protein Y032_0583g304 [Ancylostoma ceylanicum]
MVFKIGIIGGSGLEDPKILQNAKEVEINTPFGKPSDKYIEGTIGDVPCILLARHGRKHDIMPSDVNFRANLWGMHSLGASVIIATIACGSLQEDVKPGELVFPDSVFDRYLYCVIGPSVVTAGGSNSADQLARPRCLRLGTMTVCASAHYAETIVLVLDQGVTRASGSRQRVFIM